MIEVTKDEFWSVRTKCVLLMSDVSDQLSSGGGVGPRMDVNNSKKQLWKLAGQIVGPQRD